MDPERQAVIVGVGRLTLPPGRGTSSSLVDLAFVPRDLLVQMRWFSVGRSRVAELLTSVAAVGSPGMFSEITMRQVMKGKKAFRNFSRAVGNEIGATAIKDERCVRAYDGGNSPQYLVSYFADAISKGEEFEGPILVCGVEMKSTLLGAIRNGSIGDLLARPGWSDNGSVNAALPVEINQYAKPSSSRRKRFSLRNTCTWPP